nr:MAG TPA: hypothetical protein [Bacteriophage sp.]DAS65840.1 MAG TPA: hypothetical protein [Caudoviricetes sp.]
MIIIIIIIGFIAFVYIIWYYFSGIGEISDSSNYLYII